MTRPFVRLALCCNESLDDIDGIRDYTLRLVEALCEIEAVAADLCVRTSKGRWAVIDGATGDRGHEGAFHGLMGYDAVVLQYNPFMYGRWGFAPWLPVALGRLRSKSAGVCVALMVHEPYVPMVNWRWTLMGLWQRCQLAAALWESHLAFVSIDPWARSLRKLPFARPTFHLPVGSNLPDMRAARNGQRMQLNADDDTVVIATFTTGIPGRLVSHLAAAIDEVARTGRKVLVLNLGAGAPRLDGAIAEPVELVEPGRLPASELASNLAASDLFLAPFSDGVSTRRTTVMAALQHGVPVVGTSGFLTDGIFRDAANHIRLVPVESPRAFAAAAVHLVSNPVERMALGMAGRELYERSFDWPVIAQELLTRLGVALREDGSRGVPSLRPSAR
jgi:glycosyltransferase involved in cell wall biosynthesis